MRNLKIVLPNGSLWQRLVMYLAVAGYPVRDPDRTGFCCSVNGIDFFQVDRRMVPAFVAQAFDAGITGHDLHLASGIRGLCEVGQLCFSRATDQPTRWVLARKAGFRRKKGQAVTIACELPRLASILLRRASLPFSYRVIRIDGSEEQYVKEGLSDMVLVVTETTRSIRENSLEIVPGCENLLQSTPRVLARKNLPVSKEEALADFVTAMRGVVGASAVAMLTFDIPAKVPVADLKLPSAVAPTDFNLTRPGWKAYETCISPSDFGRVSRRLKRFGAKAIAMQRLEGYID